MSRPSLYTVTKDSRIDEQQTSILSSLEAKDKSRRLGMKLMLLCLVGCTLAVGFYRAEHLSAFTRAASTEKPQAASDSLEQAAARQAFAAPDVQAPAIIVAENVPPIVETVEGEKNTLASVDNKDADKVVRKNDEPTQAVTSSSPLQGSLASSAPHTYMSESKPRLPSGPEHPVKTAESRQGKDGDIELIAALLSRTSPAGERKEKMSIDPAPGTVSPDKKAIVKKEKKADPKRDVVVRSGNESSESLLKRCAALGLIEGEFCRFRICSGRWGIDPACPAASTQTAIN